MKTRNLWMSLAIGAVLALGVSTYLIAQPDIAGPGAAEGPGGRGGRGMRQAAPPPTVMAHGQNNLYVLVGGTLVKYDPVTLKELGKLELVAPPAADPAADAPAAGGPGGGRPGAGGPAAGGPGGGRPGAGGPGGGRGMRGGARPAPGAMLITPGGNEQALVVIGDQFFRVEGASFTVKAQAALPAPEAPQAAPAGDPGAPDGAPQPAGGAGPMGGFRPAELSLKGTVLYVLRGAQLVAVDTVNGKVTGTAMLPMPAAPAG